jgi:hypothetical protein
MRKIHIGKNLVSCKSAAIAVMLAGVLIFVLPGLAQNGAGYELTWGEEYALDSFIELSDSNEGGDYFEVIWGTFGTSGQSSGGEYSQIGSVGITDGNEMSGGEYTVTELSEASPFCTVDLQNFVRFAEHWDRTDCNEMNNWCNGADLDQMGDVNWFDLAFLVDEWLCYCPYGWPLR